jgi:hypothetical protein
MYDNITSIAYPEGANTENIISALIDVLPRATDQFKMINFGKTGNVLQDGVMVCRYIRSRVKYKKDGFQNQNIQLPGRFLFGTKKGDCKSYSLAFAAIMRSMGYDAGFRFASYGKNKIPTHVYNYVCVNGKKVIFDACVNNLKESDAYTYIEDSPQMKVQYLSEPACVGKPNVLKKITMSPARIAFLALVRLNFKGLATKYVKLGVTESKKFWEDFGGDWDALRRAIDAGKTKKAIGGAGSSNESVSPLTPSRMTAGGRRTEAGMQRDSRAIQGINYYLAAEGEDKGKKLEEFTKYLGPAAVIIEAIVKLFKKKKVEDPEGLTTEPLPVEPMPEQTGFKPSNTMIYVGVAGALALFYLLRKK